MKKINLVGIFEKAISAVFSVMMLFIVLSLIIGVINLFHTFGGLVVAKDLTRDYQHVISDVLTLFILIELLRSIVDYFYSHRLRMTFIVDAAIVFVLREIMIKLFEGKIATDEIYALSALLFVMSALRIASVVVHQREQKIMEAMQSKSRV